MILLGNFGLREYVLECDACECSKDRLCSKVASTEIRRSESQKFEGEAFRFDHYKAGQGEADHGKPVVEGWAGVRRDVSCFYRLKGESCLRREGGHLFWSGPASNYALLRNGHRE